MMKFGIGSYTLTWAIGVPAYAPPSHPLTPLDLLALAKDNGIPLVQFADNMPLHGLSEASLSELNDTAKTSGVSIEVGTRGTDPEHLLRYLEIASMLGSPIVRTLITEADLEGPTRNIQEVMPSFERANITLAVENHGMHTTDQLIEIFNRIKHPCLGCCLDTVNSFGALEAPQAVIEALAPFTVNLHIKDFEIRRADHMMGFVVLGTPAGYGRLDIDNLMNKLKLYRRNPTAILELWTPFTNSVEETIQLERAWFKKSVDFLKNLDSSA